MKIALIFTWYACNENCFFCSAEVDGRKHINKTTNEILKDITLEYKRGYRNIEFIWWEILIRKDINILLAFSQKIWFKEISIETNWTQFFNIDFLERLLINGLNKITLSIHWSTSKVNDYHTQLKGSFDLKLKWLDNLDKLYWKYHFNISTNYVVTSKNIDEVKTFLVLISKYRFIKKNIFAFVRPIRAYRWNYKNYLPSFLKIREVFSTLINDEKVLIQYLPYCIINEWLHEKYLDYFSKWLKKEVNKVNMEWNISLENAIQSEEYLFNECNSCKYKNKCRWVWKEYVDFFNMKSPPLLVNIE